MGRLAITTVKKLKEKNETEIRKADKPFTAENKNFLLTKLGFNDCTIKSLQFSDIEVTGAFIQTLIEKLKSNKSVQEIIFSNCTFCSKASQELKNLPQKPLYVNCTFNPSNAFVSSPQKILQTLKETVEPLSTSKEIEKLKEDNKVLQTENEKLREQVQALQKYLAQPSESQPYSLFYHPTILGDSLNPDRNLHPIPIYGKK